ncbi:MAG TPA: amino acid ABC transporter permease [Xanthobacteraceae bacterium]|jgi:general L-amino acid transport system permease protein|nr:amino acid ABC transporter permease [Xanthobacteraceae bacterium]
MSDFSTPSRPSSLTASETAQPFVRQNLLEPVAAPARRSPFRVAGLFNSVGNAILTVLAALLIVFVGWQLLRFLLLDAVWHGTSRDACLAEKTGHAVGACWPFIAAKLDQLLYGFYEQSQRWRVDLTMLLGAGVLTPLLIPQVPFKFLNGIVAFIIFPVVAFVLLVGGVFGLEHVETRTWGGLLVTLVLSFSGISASLPLGILLALARRSNLFIVRWIAIVFIEFWRGVPLIAVLFFATYMLPLFLPSQWSIAALLSVIVGVALFASAYMSEVIRGGLQAIGRGQYEGAAALGLGYWRMMGLVVLPQALRLVIPGIVNTFIGLFKDTTLVLIVAIFDFLGQLRASFADPAWATPVTLFTGFAFAGIVYFVFCFGMSRYSQMLERRVRTDRREE